MNMKATFAIILLLSLIEPIRIDAAETNYFLVAEFPGQVWVNDSYVLPLSREEDIAHARYLISRLASGELSPGDRPLVVARIAYTKDGINRNFRDPKFPEWSWHVVEFHAFGDITIEVLDGSPTQVEQRNFTGGDTIGFWAYTVVRELGPVPLYLSAIPEGLNLQLYWSGLGTNYVYTLESKESLTGTWAPVPGASWPLETNQWSVPMAEGSVMLFHVKADQNGSSNSIFRQRTPGTTY
jgi:hypothetical protein